MKRQTFLLLLLSAVFVMACGEKKTEAPVAVEPIAAEPKAKPEVVKPEVKPNVAEPKVADDAAIDKAADDSPKVDDVLTLKIEGAKKPAIIFPHKAHLEFNTVGGKCTVCHHTVGEDLSAIKGCMGEGCHDGKTEGVLKPMDAFHKTCRDCHKTELAKNKANEKLKKIRGCSGCHAK